MWDGWTHISCSYEGKRWQKRTIVLQDEPKDTSITSVGADISSDHVVDGSVKSLDSEESVGRLQPHKVYTWHRWHCLSKNWSQSWNWLRVERDQFTFVVQDMRKIETFRQWGCGQPRRFGNHLSVGNQRTVFRYVTESPNLSPKFCKTH